MENENIVRCPNCNTEINVSVLLEEQIKKDYDKKEQEREKQYLYKVEAIKKREEAIESEKNKIVETINKQVGDKLKAEKMSLEKSIKDRVQEETADQMKELQKELNEKSSQVKELNKSKAEIEKLKREKDELRDAIALEKEKEFSSKLKEEKTKIERSVEEKNYFKIKELEKVIEDLNKNIEEARKNAEHDSNQLRGEIQELEIEKLLETLFPLDQIMEIKKGQKGGDTIQVVRNNQGTECGKIYYESKRTKNFDNNWLQKLRDDNLDVKADILVLVTETMPEDSKSFFFKEGVWICTFHELKGLSMVLRHGIMKVFSVAITQSGKETKMQLLYDYLTSRECHVHLEAIIEGFKSIQDNYQEEKLKMQKIWKEREKQLEKILSNTINFYGSLKGIAGASIPDIKLLESTRNLEVANLL